MENQNEPACNQHCPNANCQHLARIAGCLSILTHYDRDQEGSIFELSQNISGGIDDLREAINELTAVIREIGEKF